MLPIHVFCVQRQNGSAQFFAQRVQCPLLIIAAPDNAINADPNQKQKQKNMYRLYNENV
jgi:hypothetical protein